MENDFPPIWSRLLIFVELKRKGNNFASWVFAWLVQDQYGLIDRYPILGISDGVYVLFRS